MANESLVTYSTNKADVDACVTELYFSNNQKVKSWYNNHDENSQGARKHVHNPF